MKGRPVWERLGFAWAGLVEGHARESSFRIHLRIAVLTLVVMLVLRPAPGWWAAIALAAALVLGFEMLNSALEGFIDLLHPGLHPEIKVVKDMAAAAVLIAGLGAIAVGTAALVDTLPRRLAEWGWTAR